MIKINSSELTGDIKRITGKLGKLGGFLDDAIPDAVNPVIVALMRIYDPPKSVSRKAAYGRTFKSKRQQRWYWWALSTGRIHVPHIRTFGMRDAWHIEGKGKDSAVINDTAAAKYTMGNDTQSRHEMLVGWTTTGWRLKNPGKTVTKAAYQGVKNAIKKAGLS